jgi:hypothetical protein
MARAMPAVAAIAVGADALQPQPGLLDSVRARHRAPVRFDASRSPERLGRAWLIALA